jgi:REP-associated tyrosine transposase
MSNHYHVVVRLYPLESVAWSDEEVVERWGQIYSVKDDDIAESTIATWRTRLADLSWFMRCINENLARRANREDGCTGRFWEGRFKSQALLDETALLKCMAYVDLNPIRAELAATPESSEHTSIKSRIEGKDGHLLPFVSTRHDGRSGIPISYGDYLSLVDWTGRALRLGKRGAIPVDHPPILERLRMEPDPWLKEMQHYGRLYYRAVGSLQALNRYCEHLGQQWLKGAGQVQVIEA